MQKRLIQLGVRAAAVGLTWLAGHLSSLPVNAEAVDATAEALVTGLAALGLFIADLILHSKWFHERIPWNGTSC